MKTPTESNLGWQGVNESTEPTFDGQQTGNNMNINNNNRFKNLEEDPPPGDGQGQNQRADQLTPMGATRQTA